MSTTVHNPTAAIWEVDAAVSGWIQNTNRTYLENALTSNVPRNERYTIMWRGRRVTNLRRQSTGIQGETIKLAFIFNNTYVLIIHIRCRR